MKKLFFSLVILVSLGFLWFKVTDLSNQKAKQESKQTDSSIQKKEILRFALVADSENDNADLEKALSQARSAGAGFVIVLGDLTTIGETSDLIKAKAVLDKSGINYFVTPGDHDLWDSRNRGDAALTNYVQVFGKPSQVFEKEGVEFLIIDNSDIYKGISDSDWQLLDQSLQGRGPVSSFPPASARSDLKSNTESGNNPELRAVGSLSRTATPRLVFVFSHKTPYHPQSSHIMGSENAQVAKQAQDFMDLMEKNKVDGFFSGDLHFFAEFSSYASIGGSGRSTSGGNSPSGVKITTVGAIDSERNFQGPRFAVVKVYSDYSWDTEDVEIR